MNQQRAWAAIAAATLLNLPMGSLYAFSVLLKPLEESLGATRSELSIVFAIATICFTLGMNLAPRLFHVAPAPVLIALCTVGGTIGLALAATADSLVRLALGYGVLFGICGGAAYIFLQQGVNLLVHGHRGLVNGYIVSLYPAGAMIAAPAFGWALTDWGVRGTIAGLAGVVAATGLAATALVLHAGVQLPPAARAATPTSGPSRVVIFWQIWTAFFLAAAAGLTVLSQAAGIIVAYGGSTAMALGATTAITGAIAAARLGGGWLVDQFPIPVVMAAAHVLALAGTITLTLWPTPLVSLATLAMIGMGYGFISGSTAGAVAFYWPSSDYGRIASRLYIAWCTAAVTLPVLAGHLYDLSGGYRLAVIIAGAGNLLGIVVACFLPRQSPAAAKPGDVRP
ncbi:nitrate/nitrite transporter [Reyranella sp. CPCC 100927]|uniref:MFS transporter n=1 Tax=Reyranella sp. CPCC 100927 TaxID=2599616 RepID=UPI0015B71193|nr:MFS transporter [Reyranella sp. CPCC 100927]